MFRGRQDNHPDNSTDYATKLSNLFSKGDIINKEIDETLDEAFRDNATKILLLKKQISNINLTQKFSNINLTQKFSNSIDSELQEYNLVHFKLQKISHIRAFLIHAESKDFKNLIRDKKIVNIVKNLTIIVNLKSLCFKTLDKKPDLYDEIYLDLFSQYCNIYKEIKKEQKERSENKPDGLRSGVLLQSTVCRHPLDSVVLSSAPSKQPRVRFGGIMPLIKYYEQLRKEETNGVKL